ncbi:hypothetical protein WOLCODRAFT_137497 [Wolfiporia cocos MD-104 SS10]|uniref:Uncharacterized protein n=1 Tax=Wolfiporia cocos (strain MD-104) TaxID=742152 RepID=A0A2H3JY09_WOLCO|nr:hypothetical protein WOLCODRAFT_137497 [Wolfiporia cocos MD-104 SS10]
MTAVGLPMSSYALSSEESDYGTNTAPHLRPKVVRRDTDNILSYYQSEYAGQTYTASTPITMRMESSSSDSDHHADVDTDSPGEFTSPGHHRRPSVPTEGGADRRRLAIVELGPTLPLSISRKHNQPDAQASSNKGASTSSTLLSRRGIHVDGLALVAPPDASPGTYTNLTPPSTAPLTVDRGLSTSASHPVLNHHRSQSEAVTVPARALTTAPAALNPSTTTTSKLRHQHKSSRDVGIVGVVSAVPDSVDRRGELGLPVFQTPGPSPGRTPDPPEPSALGLPPLSTSSSTLTTPEREILTPAIGESKDISQPVVGPVVVGLTSEAMRPRDHAESVSSSGESFTTHRSSHQHQHQFQSSHRRYDPAVDATAGPLPPPPRPLFDSDASHLPSAVPAPPRPLRTKASLPPPAGAASRHDIHALRDALQLPPSVSARLASLQRPVSPKQASSDLPADSRDSEAGPLRKRSLHVREGAHPPSTALNTPILPEKPPEFTRTRMGRSASPPRSPSPSVDGSHESAHNDPDVTPTRTIRIRRSGLDLRRVDSWVSVSSEHATRPPALGSASASSLLSSSSSSSAICPTPPPKSVKETPADERPSTGAAPRRGALTNLKRFSALPRVPSVASLRAKSTTSAPSRTPSPPRPSSPPSVSHAERLARHRALPKFRAAWPNAMHYKDVAMKPSALERSLGYAHKINELAMHDCGLADWVEARRHPGGLARSSSSTTRVMFTPATPSVPVFVPEPRHVSEDSAASIMTFPIRPDAYSATDLTSRAHDIMPSTSPPPLPYPSLAVAQRTPAFSSTAVAAAPRTLLPALSASRSVGGGFFASIGRKNSMKKDRPVLVAKGKPVENSAPRPAPVQITTTPTVPGGPRAAPGRIQRSQTFSVSMSPPVAGPPHVHFSSTRNPRTPSRQSTVAARRPSIFARARAGQPAPAPVISGRSAVPPPPPSSVRTPEFEQQVDKLADVLPHADRDVLAGYLYRTGHDILAVGQYLEDQKNGVLQHD